LNYKLASAVNFSVNAELLKLQEKPDTTAAIIGSLRFFFSVNDGAGAVSD